MLRRRATAILSALLLAHLMVAGDLAACVDAVDHASADFGGPTAAAHDHDAGSHTTTHPAPADRPVPSQCCSAMMSCAVTLIAAGATAPMNPAAESRDTRDGPQRTPASMVRAPDPPPPKA